MKNNCTYPAEIRKEKRAISQGKELPAAFAVSGSAGKGKSHQFFSVCGKRN